MIHVHVKECMVYVYVNYFLMQCMLRNTCFFHIYTLKSDNKFPIEDMESLID